MLVLDDLQWGRDATGLVEHLFKHAPDLPVLVLMTVQPARVDRASALAETLDAIRAREGCDRLELIPLEAYDQRTLIERLLPIAQKPADYLVAQTDGIPLFAIQVLGEWIARGALEPGDGAFSLTAPGVELPLEDLDELWDDRIERVVAACRETVGERDTRKSLELAAALGVHVDLEEWRAVCERAGVVADDAVYEQLIRSGLAEPRAAGWSFAHALLVEAIARQAEEAGRWQSHNRHCARTLASLYADDNARVQDRRSEHLLEAGDDRRVVGPLFALARDAAELEQYDRVERRLDEIEELMERHEVPAGDRRWFRIGRYRARVSLETGDLAEAERWIERLVERAADHGRSDQTGWGALLAGRLETERADYERALEWLDRAGAAFDDRDEHPGVAQVYRQRGVVYRRRGRFDEAREALSEAWERFRHGETIGRAIDAALELADVSIVDGCLQEAHETAERTLMAARALGDDTRRSRAWVCLGEARRLADDWEKAEQAYRRALELRLPIVECAWIAERAAEAAIARGEVDRADALLERAVDWWNQIGRPQRARRCQRRLSDGE
ncbi:MAG: hypothetical protein ABEN55_07515 [Bradymonadaceae bacterium]